MKDDTLAHWPTATSPHPNSGTTQARGLETQPPRPTVTPSAHMLSPVLEVVASPRFRAGLAGGRQARVTVVIDAALAALTDDGGRGGGDATAALAAIMMMIAVGRGGAGSPARTRSCRRTAQRRTISPVHKGNGLEPFDFGHEEIPELYSLFNHQDSELQGPYLEGNCHAVPARTSSKNNDAVLLPTVAAACCLALQFII